MGMKRSLRGAALAAIGLGSIVGAHALSINISFAAGINASAQAAITRAAQRWEARLFDPVRVNLTADFQNLGAGVGGGASPAMGTVSYGATRTALINDITSNSDVTATNNLPATQLDFWLNRTNNSPNGVGSATPFFDTDGDANNTTIRMTLANARALGLFAAQDNTVDANMVFGSGVNWDFDASNGINPSQFDFEGVVTHEIGHALGFISGIDTFEANAPNGAGNFFNDDQLTLVSPLDIYRFSNRGGQLRRDFALDNAVSRFFSIDNGATNLGPFSTGVRYGDGFQASHWQNRSFPGQTALGIMDPQITNGELGVITPLDLQAMDVIGWNVVPEPGTMAAIGIGMLGLLSRRRRKQN